MMKNTIVAAALSFVAFAPALSPAHAQDVSTGAADEAVDAMEYSAAEVAEIAEAVAAQAATEAAAVPTEPQLTEFGLLQNNPADYPPSSWVNDEEGTAYYELAVDADGGVTGCTIIESTGHEMLDAQTCEIAMERGAFVPAYDETGSPVAGTHRDYQVWTKREPQFPGTSTIHVRFTATPDGVIEDCEVIEVMGAISAAMRQTMENEPCPGMNRSARPPYRDEGGNPIAKRVDLMIVVKTEDVAE